MGRRWNGEKNMSRKHFQAIATALHDSYATMGVIAAVADALAVQNPRFDRARFVRVALEGGR
jgi:hypothetical protein